MPARILLAGAVVLALGGVTPILADTYYLAKTYDGDTKN